MSGSGGPTAVVLAAGEGKRLKSRTTKVLHPVAGRPMLAHVLAALEGSGAATRAVVVAASRRDEIAEAMVGHGFADITYVVQDPPRGTGDAVRVAVEALRPSGDVLVLPGDTPLVTRSTVQRVLEAKRSSGAAAVLVAARVASSDSGRIVRAEDGSVSEIVEVKDATAEQLSIDEINAGIYVFEAPLLEAMLGKIDDANAQGEYYLTDVIGLLFRDGHRIEAVEADAAEVGGVNSRAQLAQVIRSMRDRVSERWLEEGVTIIDPSSTFIDPTVELAPDVVIHPFSFLEGSTTVAEGAEIGPQTRIVDSSVGPGAVVTFAVVRGCTIGSEASVGPFASLRAGTHVGERARAGTFVETKASTIGEDSKVPHLSYIGDAEIGRGVNVGAGTITCNWDGSGKHGTVIDDDAYIGSDTMLVAPVHIGERAATGAGAVVRGEVPADSLAVGVPARVIEGKGDKMRRGSRPVSSKAAESDRPDSADGSGG